MTARSPIAQKIESLARGETAVFDWPRTVPRLRFAARIASLRNHAQKRVGAVYRTASTERGVEVRRVH